MIERIVLLENAANITKKEGKTIKELLPQLKKELKQINSTIHLLQRNKKAYPEGSLRTCTRDERITNYYHIYYDDSGQKHTNYLSKKNQSQQIKKLAQKQYEEKLEKILIKQQMVLDNFISNYNPIIKDALYDSLSDSRKKYVTKLTNSNEQIFNKWKEEKISPYLSYPEQLIYPTNRGENVRSKTEMYIANQLNSIPDIWYRYEAPLYLKSQQTLVHPDFTIMRKSDNKIFFWEHFGRMNDLSYVDNHCQKIYEYIKEDIIQDGSFIATYESTNIPVDIDAINQLIKEYFIDESK